MPITRLVYVNQLKKAKRGRNTHGFAYVSVYVETRRCIKTQLEVPDNRLCNCCNASVTCSTQIMLTFLPARAKCD